MTVIDRYVSDVVDGRVPAGTYHRLACVRHQSDLARQGAPGFPYRWDQARVDRFIRFVGQLRHYKGEWAGQPIALEPWQQFILGSLFGWVHRDTGLRRFRYTYFEIPRKNGKALSIDTLVPTPTGFVRHGELCPGDYVFGVDGKPKRVEWVSGHYEGPCFEVKFSGGQSIVAHARHEWVTHRTYFTGRPRGHRDKRPLPPVETATIAKTLTTGGKQDNFVHRVMVPSPLELPDAPLPIPPYTFGAWLGDGTSSAGAITCADDGIVDCIRREGVPCGRRGRKGRAHTYALTTGERSQRARDGSVASALRRMGVLNNKHIPMLYKRASRDQRFELLRGIVDTDGHCTKRGQYEVVSVHERLAKDIVELVHSLGMKASLVVDRATLRGVDCGPRYRIQFYRRSEHVSNLTRKQPPAITSTWKRRSLARTIVGAVPCDPAIVNCIQVEGGLYLVGEQMIPTHNSTIAATAALYLAFFDGEAGAEVYTVATKREQAKIVFNDAKKMIESSAFKGKIGIRVANLHRMDTTSKLEPLGADHDSTDGLNPNGVIVDEWHAMKDRGLIDVMETATGARQQPVIFGITTAGSDIVSPCGDQHTYACSVLEGTVQNDVLLAFIAHADPSDDWREEATWRKANPNYGVSVKPEDMRALAEKARNMPAAAATFQQKRLNLWVNTDQPWLSLDGWRKGQTTGRTWAQFAESLAHESCYVGIDLASKLDLMALVAVFPPTAGRSKWALLRWAWTPEETLRDRAHRDRAPYDVWVQQGHLQTTPGTGIDQSVIRETLRWIRDRYDIERIGFDPWHADKLIAELVSEDGFAETQVLAVPQTYAGMSSGCAAFEADVLAGHVDANNCPLMAWTVGNAVVQRDGKDNIYPVKRRSRGRIDPVMAACIGFSLAKRFGEQPSQAFTGTVRNLADYLA